jgi:hypothetical protein|tara:strand:+ start:4826 stop:6550 length:1725 start_codon:yes stop_codon:yes gene_type:complete
MTSFELPIYYNEFKKTLPEQIDSDLELSLLYGNIFSSDNEFGNLTQDMWKQNYTNDKKYLKDTQKLLKNKFSIIKNIGVQDNSNQLLAIWDKININNNNNNNNNQEDDLGFHSKYQYIEWEKLHFLNKNSDVLQLMSIYNLSSPIISLCIPIIFLLIPFIILRVKGTNLTVENYYKILMVVFQKHQLGQLFNLSSATWDKRIYILISFGFYILQIYQNVRCCISFYNNMKVINGELFELKEHINNVLQYYDFFENICEKLSTYDKFITNMKIHKHKFLIMKKEIDTLGSLGSYKISLNNFKQIGKVMKLYYELYQCDELKNSLEYSLYFSGYVDNLFCLQDKIDTSIIGKCKFTKKQTKFVNAFYPLIQEKPIKNTYNLDKNILITGPNAAGKTTIVKTTIFNIIISQQIGYGFYDKAYLHIYDFIHSYINIPDTSGRDSLFQAEARRCENILTLIENNKDKRHFCVFDELYSGTNPYEAIATGVSFLKYLNNYSSVSFIITTHFIELCNRLNNNKKIINCNMNVNVNDEKLEYKYKIIDGISKIKGGVNVLKDLKYPEEIIENTKNIISDLII